MRLNRAARVTALFALSGAPASAQDAAVFQRLEGAWTGEGELLGRPAAFTMRWVLRPGDVAVLTFANAFRESGGARTPVLDATAVYRTSPEHADAHWTDSRGVLVRIRWEATDSTLTAHWEAPTERGRTVYRVSGSAVEVTDHVRSGADWRRFATARYARAAAGLPAADPALEPARWIAGCWRRGGGQALQEERWSPPAGDAMIGVSRTVRNGVLSAFEYLRIQVVDGRPTYVALPSNQAETRFPLAEAAGDTMLAFENRAHDFPQRIEYHRSGDDRITAWIEGPSDGAVRRIPFAFVRVACEG